MAWRVAWYGVVLNITDDECLPGHFYTSELVYDFIFKCDLEFNIYFTSK